MKRHHILLCALLLLLASTASAANKRHDTNLYQQWVLMPDSVLVQRGYTFYNASKSDSALLMFSIVANRHRQQRLQAKEVPLVVKALYMSSMLYELHFYDFQKAYNDLTHALDISERYHYRQLLPHIYRGLAGISFTNGDVHQYSGYKNTALQYYKKGFHAGIDIKDYGSAVSNFINIINLASDSASLADIRPEVEALKSLPAKSTHMYRYALQLCLGTEAYIAGDYPRALAHFRQMEQHITSGNSEQRARFLMQVYSKYSQTYFSMGDERQGVEWLHAIEKRAREENMVDLLTDAYRTLHEYYRDHNDTERSSHYQLLYLQTKDSIMTQHSLESVNHARFINELDRMTEQMQLLDDQRRQRGYIIIGIAALALMLAVVIFIIIRNHRAIDKKNRRIYLQSVELLETERQQHQQTALLLGRSREQLMRTERELSHAEYQLQLNAATHQPAQKSAKAPHTAQSDTEEMQAVYQKVTAVMADTQLVCTNGFTIQQLAAAIGESQRKTSEAINGIYGDSFSALVSEYRIREACRLINDPAFYATHSMTGIAEQVGIKSRTQFSNLFKRIVGMSPSAYARQMRENTKEQT